MPTVFKHKCPYCPKAFEKQRSLTYHINHTARCWDKESLRLNHRALAERTAFDALQLFQVEPPPDVRNFPSDNTAGPPVQNHAGSISADNNGQLSANYEDGPDDGPDDGPGMDGFSWHPPPDEGDDDEANRRPRQADTANTYQITDKFVADYRLYAAESKKNRFGFSSAQMNALNLMQMLRKSKAPLSAYEDIMEWHYDAIRNTPHLRNHLQTVEPVTRSSLFTKLFRRYNMHGKINRTAVIRLPYSDKRVPIVTNDLGWCIESLLTDPSIIDCDYLFNGPTPFVPPKRDLERVGGGHQYLGSIHPRVRQVHQRPE